MDLSYTFGSMVEKEQETLCPPTEDAECRKDKVVEEETDLEPHVLLLQKFLGKQLAQQFLDPSHPDQVNAVHPLLLEKTGQSAKDYWRLLREHSEAQLQEMTTSQETIKSSLLAKMPTSKFVDNIQDFRRTLGIMYRASKINQDKAILIMSNNPLPDFNEWQENESLMQYLCKEVIQTKKHFLLPSLKCSDSKEDGATNEQGTESGKRSYRFVTKDTYEKYKGGFSNHFREQKSQVLKGTCNLPACIQLASINANKDKPEDAATACTWEPLSYTALMDSRPFITVPRKGDFRHGQPIKWINSANHSNID